MLRWLLGKSEGQSAPETTPLVDMKPHGSEPAPEPTPEPEAVGEVEKIAPAIQIRSQCPPPAVAETQAERELERTVDKVMDECESIISAPGFDLPMLPAAAMKLMRMTQTANVDIKEVSSTVMFDPILTAKFLKMANSAHYGSRRKIDSVLQATTMMGMNTVKNLVTSIALNGTIFKDKRLTRNAKLLWTHSISSALSAAKLADLLKIQNGSIFLAGLLHDIGKVPALLLIQKAMMKKGDARPELLDALIERHHVRAGIALLAKWDLPKVVGLVMGAHHAVNTLEEAEAQVALRDPELDKHQKEIYAQVLSVVVLADKAQASIGLVDEPGDVDIVGSRLASDLRMEITEAPEFLQKVIELQDQAAEFSS